MLLEQLLNKIFFSYNLIIMKQANFEKLLNILFPELKLIEYLVFERFECYENGRFTNKIAPAIFIKVYGKYELTETDYSEELTRWTGFNVSVDKS
jgi:hypothetical protein